MSSLRENLAIQTQQNYSKALLDLDVSFLDLHQHNSSRYPFLLESHRYSNENSRYDILFAFPGEVIECGDLADQDFFKRCEKSFNTQYISEDIDGLPFRGGWFLFFSYEVLALIEPRLSSIPTNQDLPIASVTRIPAAIIRDHRENKLWLVCEQGSEALFDDILDDIQRLKPTLKSATHVKFQQEKLSKDSFKESVTKVLNYLEEGDTLQVNLSRLWQGVLEDNVSSSDIYQLLKQNNPAPFSGLALIRNQIICSSSPERLVRCQSGKVDMRPIAGTRPRGKDSLEDQLFAEQLLADSKESAEHIMLLDLIRNDLGRICKTGTIEVNEKMILESYASVHHIVSNVCGELVAGLTPIDIIKAVFPGGTITGCPKVRCMEIINELEQEPRGIYTGSMGYANFNGDMDLNILIRSLLINDRSVSFRAGAGIVADSNPDDEFEETQYKANGLIRALAGNVN